MPATPATVKLPVISFGLKASQQTIDEDVIMDTRNPSQGGRGNIDVSGSGVVPVDEIFIGYWLKAMFGDPTTTGTGDPYTHVWKLSDQLKSMAIEQGFNDVTHYFQYNGCKINKFSIEFSNGNDNINANMDLLGAKRTVANAPMDASPNTGLLKRFSNTHLAILENGTSLGIVRSANMNVEFDLDGEEGYTIGSGGERTEITEGIVKITGNLKVFFRDRVLLDKAINGVETSLKFAFTNGTHGLEFFLPQVQFDPTDPTIENSKGIQIELPYRAYLSTNADATALKTTLKNSHASYATIAS
jgi:hypothetical protein